jgi:tetratricopeptide (TPR) repeat protein
MDKQIIFKLCLTLCALLAFSFPASADEIQDANKLFKQGQKTQALDKVNGFLAAHPKDAQARFLKGLIINDQGNTQEAIKIFTELTDDYPELPEPYNNLAVLYAGKGMYEKAKAALEMALRTHPNYPTAHENLGDIYAKMASQSYERAVQLDKSNAGTQAKLALIRELFSKGKVTNKVAPPPAVDTVEPASSNTLAAPVSARIVTPAESVIAGTIAQSASATGVDAQVLKSLTDWAAAWSAKDSSKYLAYYAKSYKTPAGANRATWEAQRKASIAKPKSIRVLVRDAEVKILDNQSASVRFKQIYRASNLKTSTTKIKTLLWVNDEGTWKIAEERTLK